MKNKPFNITTFFVSILCIGFLTFISFIGMAAEEEGTSGVISSFLCLLHKVFEFPSFTLFAKYIFESRNFANYIFAYAVNCIFYGIMIERIFTLKIKL